MCGVKRMYKCGKYGTERVSLGLEMAESRRRTLRSHGKFLKKGTRRLLMNSEEFLIIIFECVTYLLLARVFTCKKHV